MYGDDGNINHMVTHSSFICQTHFKYNTATFIFTRGQAKRDSNTFNYVFVKTDILEIYPAIHTNYSLSNCTNLQYIPTI